VLGNLVDGIFNSSKCDEYSVKINDVNYSEYVHISKELSKNWPNTVSDIDFSGMPLSLLKRGTLCLTFYHEEDRDNYFLVAKIIYGSRVKKL
jgi:hypothetical protein